MIQNSIKKLLDRLKINKKFIMHNKCWCMKISLKECLKNTNHIKIRLKKLKKKLKNNIIIQKNKKRPQ